jgi:8-oxo-dGTP pyrophosphatase MutT (NUDIX family)
VVSGTQLFRTVPPDTPPKHLVVYFIPVDAAQRCLLLGDHRKPGRWLPPGGHVEDGEDSRLAVIRETREELGIAAEFDDDRPFFLTVTPTKGANRHLDVDLWFVLRVATHEPRDEPRGKPPTSPRQARKIFGRSVVGSGRKLNSNKAMTRPSPVSPRKNRR